MKKYLAFFAVLGLLVACQGKDNPFGGNEIAATSISLSKNSVSLQVGDSETLTATVEPANTTDKLEWSSSAEDIATVKDGTITAVAHGTATITAKAGSQTANCTVIVKNPAPKGAVDLGLSVYWASCNLCDEGFVNSPEDYGDYYAWGEVESKERYMWDTYKWGVGTTSSDIYLTKYNFISSRGDVDYKFELEPSDDAAHVILGGNWRIPTMEECLLELISKCTWEWTTQNGVKGSKITGPNGNSIFLPAAGAENYPDETTYWTSTLYENSPVDAIHMYIFRDGKAHCGNHGRLFGLPIRPVSD